MTPSLRVLVVTNWYPPHHYGGYELSCHDVNNRLSARGHDVHVLCSDHVVSGAAPPDPEAERRVRRQLRLYWRAETLWEPAWRERLRIERQNQDSLRRALDEVQPDVVAVWQVAAMSVGLLTTLIDEAEPLVFAICDDWLTYAVRQDPWARPYNSSPPGRAIGRAVARLTGLPTVLPDVGAAGAFLFVSDATRRTALEVTPWRYPRSTVVYSGIESSVFALDPAPAVRPWGWRLLWVGRFDPRKGADTAVESLVAMPDDATLVVCGRGDPAEAARVRTLAVDLGLGDRVTVLSAERHELPALYRGADAFLFTSTWAEPFGLTPIEAMACGTPVVATALGGSAEFLVDGGNCVTVPPADPAAVATAVDRLAGDEELRATIVDGGRRTAAELTTDHLADVFEVWLVAAADHFRNGQPPHRRLPTLTMAARDPYQPAVDAHPLTRHQALAPDVLASGDAEAIKRLYVELGSDWWSAVGDGLDEVPVLSAPETCPVVLGELRGVKGLVLDAGCGPNPAVSLALAADAARTVVSLDIGWGTVRLARELATRAGVGLLAVAGDLERLPFRAEAFDAVACDDAIEHVPDDATAAAELARVARPGATIVVATPNRHNADIVRRKLRDRTRRRRRPAADYFVSNSHLREYSWDEAEALVRPVMHVVRRAPVGWERGPRARLATRLLRLPILWRFSQMIVLTGRPR